VSDLQLSPKHAPHSQLELNIGNRIKPPILDDFLKRHKAETALIKIKRSFGI
jgi:hypothetical protein